MGKWHVLLGDRVLEQFWVAEESAVKVGRGNLVDVSLDNTAVSRKHALIGMRNGRYYVKDLDSVNGTRVNGEKITGSVAVTLSDCVEIAKFRLIPTSADGSTYPPFAMVQDPHFDPAPIPVSPADFDGTVFVVPRELVLVKGEAIPERISLKNQPRVAIGTDRRCHIRVEGRGVGPIHCYVMTKGDKHYILHKTGRKHTTVNGKKNNEGQILRKGDIIGIGKTEIRYT